MTHGVGGLSDEVWVSEHVLVVEDEAKECSRREEDLEVEPLVPNWVEPVVL